MVGIRGAESVDELLDRLSAPGAQYEGMATEGGFSEALDVTRVGAGIRRRRDDLLELVRTATGRQRAVGSEWVDRRSMQEDPLAGRGRSTLQQSELSARDRVVGDVENCEALCRQEERERRGVQITVEIGQRLRRHRVAVVIAGRDEEWNSKLVECVAQCLALVRASLPDVSEVHDEQRRLGGERAQDRSDQAVRARASDHRESPVGDGLGRDREGRLQRPLFQGSRQFQRSAPAGPLMGRRREREPSRAQVEVLDPDVEAPMIARASPIDLGMRLGT